MTKDQYIARLQRALIAMKDAVFFVYNTENALSDESCKAIQDAGKKCIKLLKI